MFRTIRRRPHISSESSDDESPQQTKPRRTTFSTKNVHSSTSTESINSHEKSVKRQEDNRSNSVSSAIKPRKKLKRLPSFNLSEDSSSSGNKGNSNFTKKTGSISTAGTSGLSKLIIDNASNSMQKMDIFDSSSIIDKYPTRFRRQSGSSSSDISPRKWHKKPAVVNSSDDSTNSENEKILHPVRRRALRDLNGYESGDSLDRVHKPTVSQEGRASDSSSDDGILQSHSGFKRLPDINPVTSDTSDSGIPVVLNRIRKRRRIRPSKENDTNLPNQRSRNMQQDETNRSTRTEAQRDTSDEPARMLSVSPNASNGHVRRILSRTRSANNRNRRIRRAANTSRNQNHIRNEAITMDDERMIEGSEEVNRSMSSRRMSVLRTLNSSVRRSRIRAFDEANREIAFERTGTFNTEYVIPEMERDIIDTSPERTATTNSGNTVVSRQTVSQNSANDITFRHAEDSNVPFFQVVPAHSDSSDSDGMFGLMVALMKASRARTVELVNLVDDVTQDSDTNKIITNCASDIDVESEKCPICWSRFTLQEVGNPAICKHSYCISCIEKWSKKNNTCPVDRLPFQSIVVRSRLQGKAVRIIHIPVDSSDDDFPIPPQLEFVGSSELGSEDDETERCVMCNNSTSGDAVVECDGCSQPFHLECIIPPLPTATEWFCSECMHSRSRSSPSNEFPESN